MVPNVGPFDSGSGSNEGAGFEMIGRPESFFAQYPARADQKFPPWIQLGIERYRLRAAKLEVKFEMILQVSRTATSRGSVV